MADVVIKPVKKSGSRGGGAKKYGRNEMKCKAYRAQGRKEKNRTLRLGRAAKRELKLQALREKRRRAS